MNEQMTYHDPQYQIYNGEAVEVLKTLPSASVDMILTSPPYFGLRKYKAPDVIFDNHNGCEHEFMDVIKPKQSGSNVRITLEGGCTGQNNTATKFNQVSVQCSKCGAWRGQLGLEPTPELFIRHLCDIFDACKLVLKKTGTLWVNIDDSYSGSGGTDNQFSQIERGLNIVKPIQCQVSQKSLIAIPARFQIEMINRGWICRNVIIWHKGNPMPESVKDRFTNDFEYLFMFSQQERYYFEQQFEKLQARKPGSYNPGNKIEKRRDQINFDNEKGSGGHFDGHLWTMSDLGRNKRAVWKINTKGYKDAHFATFPPALCTTPILAGCPEFICSKCGKPRVKMYTKPTAIPESWNGSRFDDGKNLEVHPNVGRREDAVTSTSYPEGSTANRLALLRQQSRENGQEYTNQKKEVGLSDCGCGAGFHPGTVMDIFSGSGTVAEEARKLGRKAILIDVSSEYCEMAVKRVSRLPIPQGVAL